MPHLEIQPQPSRQRIGLQWVLLVLVLGVLILSSLAFVRPISQDEQTPTPMNTASITPEDSGTPEGTGTPLADPNALPPTPEEIGYTDGIIFCSTVLVLILLVGTLRETVRRKGR
jgi:hypothetical protein